ncbi:hypothetical protein [Nitratifractor sp.]
MTEWMLNKEEEMAKNCAISIDEIDRQIEKVEEKRKSLEAECRDNLAELDKIITKLKWIKSEEIACQREREKKKSEGV